jgi:hypothetical protein
MPPKRTARPFSSRLSPSLLLAAMLGAALFGGCGSSDNGVASKSGKEILAASKQAAESASSVRVKGRSSQKRLSSSIDLRLTSNGGRGRVKFLGLDYEVVRIDNTIYVKGGKAFYEQLSAVLRKKLPVPEGTWLRTSATASPLWQLADVTSLKGELDRLLSTPGPVTKGAHMTVAGQKALQLKEKTKLYEGSLFVATTGKPYPIEQVKTGKGERGRTTFSGWGKPISLTAPSPSVELGALTR